MFTGKIVQFFESQQLTTGVCLEDTGTRLHIFTINGRELNTNANRLLHASSYCVAQGSSKDNLVRFMQEFCRKQRELMRQVDVNVLWEHLRGEGEVFDTGYLSHIVFGDNADSDHAAAVLLALLEDRIRFKLHCGRFKINTPEQVAAIKIKRERDDQRQRIIEDGSIWLDAVMQGKNACTERQELFIQLLKEFILYGSEAPEYQLTREILDQAKITDPKACFDVLVKLGVYDVDENLGVARYKIRTEWPVAAAQEVDALINSGQSVILQDTRRQNLTHVPIFSIDDPVTRDIDDAISFEKLPDGYCRVGIHITDVASRIKPACALDREAEQRATSIYLPEGKIPMLPPTLSEELLSLQEGTPRPALSILVTLQPTGEIVNSEVMLSIIQVSRRMSYEEVDAEMAHDQIFADLYQVAAARMEKRKQAGALVLSLPELQVMVDSQKHIQVRIRERTTPSQIIVSECMILANYLAAQFLRDKNIPALYRKQGHPREAMLAEEPPSLFQLIRQCKLLNRVEVGLEPGRHAGLGLDVYTTITSPLRKYYDLIVQRQLVSVLSGTAPPYGKNDLRNIVGGVDARLTSAALIEQERQRYWLLKYLENKTGTCFAAIVIDKRPRGYRILINDYMLETHVAVAEGEEFVPGESITVMLEKVDPFYGTLKVSCRQLSRH